MTQNNNFALVEYKMLEDANQKEDEQVQKQKEMQSLIQGNRFNGTIQYSDSFLANNYNKLQMQLNSRYISQICCPRRTRGSLPHVRMRPYYIPQRSRTKSENSDPSSLMYLETIRAVDAAQSNLPTTLMETNDPSTSQMDTSGNPPSSRSGKCSSLVKSKSLEDLVRAIKTIDGSQPSHEMEFMSSRIQNLKVQE
ncbi:uncharacterized protein LOC135708049 [Ochlerotatus camptorhynchus]|uniref:uncharacterized protein LOC135708049 n=1 Tax=Ochlerotatus camptorhynchus TaxID=644619 RepID=UPI0031CE6707